MKFLDDLAKYTDANCVRTTTKFPPIKRHFLKDERFQTGRALGCFP